MSNFAVSTHSATQLANITGEFNAGFPRKDDSGVKKRRADFHTQQMQYVSDGKEFMITAIAERGGRQSERRIALHLRGDVTSGTYSFNKNDTSGPIIQLVYSEMENIGNEHFLIPFETTEGTLELEVSEDREYYTTRSLNFTAASRTGLTLEIEADFEVWLAVILIS
jgi:hypothetical protein